MAGVSLSAAASLPAALAACDQHLLFPPVPPSKPTVNIPSSATIGSRAVLTCSETDGSPPSQYLWYRDGVRMPPEPKSSRAFSNSSYSLNPKTGELVWRGGGRGGHGRRGPEWGGRTSGKMSWALGPQNLKGRYLASPRAHWGAFCPPGLRPRLSL